jgi:hypothetical protein
MRKGGSLEGGEMERVTHVTNRNDFDEMRVAIDSNCSRSLSAGARGVRRSEQQLGVVKTASAVCVRNGVQYYVANGTALPAIALERHHMDVRFSVVFGREFKRRGWSAIRRVVIYDKGLNGACND